MTGKTNGKALGASNGAVHGVRHFLDLKDLAADELRRVLDSASDLKRKRVKGRLADERPMALEYTTLAGFCFDSIDLVGESLYQTLDAAGFRPSRALQRLRATAFTAEQAELLTVEQGHAGLLIERRTFLDDGRAVEYTVSYYRGDAYDFVAELSAA